MPLVIYDLRFTIFVVRFPPTLNLELRTPS
jgi:hypothetical protein